MGQGSRGGNSGLSSSGQRQRDDKELKKAERSPKRVGDGGGREGKGRASDGKKDEKKDKGSGGPNRRGAGNLRGIRAHRLPHLRLPHLPTTSSSGSAAKKSGSAKTSTPPSVAKAAGIKKISRIKPTKVKLTKQRTNKAPN